MRTRLARALRRVANRLMPQPTVVYAQMDGEAIVRAIEKYRRQRGL